MEDISIGTAGLGERRQGAGMMGLPAQSGHILKICRAPIVGVQASIIPLVWWGFTIISCGSGGVIKCLLSKWEDKGVPELLTYFRCCGVLLYRSPETLAVGTR